MSKLSFRARALDASKPLPVFRCEDLPDLHEYASINRAVPQMPTGMEKEEESVRVNSPVRPAARPAPLLPAAAEQPTHTKWPPSSPRRRLSVAGRAAPPPPPTATPGRRGPAGPPLGPPADPGPWYPGPAEFGGPKGTKGSRDEAAGSHFVVLVLGLGLVHPARGAGWVAVGVRRAAEPRAAEAPPAGLSARRWVALRGRRRAARAQPGTLACRWPGTLLGALRGAHVEPRRGPAEGRCVPARAPSLLVGDAASCSAS